MVLILPTLFVVQFLVLPIPIGAIPISVGEGEPRLDEPA